MAATQWLSIGMGLLLAAFLVCAFLLDECSGRGDETRMHISLPASLIRGPGDKSK
jgi:hypothetical protein